MARRHLEVVQEVLADLKSSMCVQCLMHFGFAVFRKEMGFGGIFPNMGVEVG